MFLVDVLDRRGQEHEAFVADYTPAFPSAEVREGEQLYVQPPEGWTPKLLQDGRRVKVEGAKSRAGLANISEALAGTPVKQIERARFHSR